MAQQNATINGTLIFTGTFAGQASIQAQPIGGNLIFQLPNQLPTVNQLLSVESVSGSVVTIGFAASQTAPSFSSITGSLALTQIAQSGATVGEVIQWNGSSWAPSSSAPGSGTVTSVALTAPGSVFSVGGSPITTSGTLALTLATQSPNQVWAGPTSGGAATPAFRALVSADIGTGIVSIAAINSKRGTGGFVQLAASGTSGVATDIVTFDVNGNTIDSGVLIGSLAPLASPTFTGTVVLPSAVNATASSDLIFTAAGTNKVRIATAVGTFDFFGTGGGMSLATQNASMAIDATGNVTIAATTVGGTATTTIQGGAGGIQINSSGKGETQMLGPISINAFTVSTLPVGAEAFVLYAVDGRKVGEGVGAGTGVPVYFSNGLWRVFSTDAQVQA